MLKKIFRFVFNRLVFELLALAILFAVIWWLGQELKLGRFVPLAEDAHKLLLIGAILFWYLLAKAWRQWKKYRAEGRLNKNMFGLGAKADKPKAEETAAEREVALFKEQIRTAMSNLKRRYRERSASRSSLVYSLVRPRQFLYELPWYMFIGAPGSGKTTALEKSDLHFLVESGAQDKAVRGVGGTRNCDWWFTADAVFLDTAGRYATQDSDPERDAGAWQGFLKLLRQSRPRRPLNGILLTVSVSDLLGKKAEVRTEQAQKLAARLTELHQAFQLQLPVYVLVTKCDLLAGFEEYFSEYGGKERGQIWGMTFPQPDPNKADVPLERFGAEFDVLEKRLNDGLIERVQAERDLGHRARVYTFPQQFGALKGVLQDFLVQVFASVRAGAAPMIRGVYFTSGTQTGNPIDRIVGALSRQMRIARTALPVEAHPGKSYFVTDVLKNVLFPEQDLAGTNVKRERRQVLLQSAALAGIAVLSIAMLIAWTISYRQNSAYLEEVRTKLAAAKQAVAQITPNDSSDLVELLPVLQDLQQLPATETSAAAHWSMGWGLSQYAAITQAAGETYVALLRDAFLVRMARSLEHKLRSADPGSWQGTYDALMAYLAVYDARCFDLHAARFTSAPNTRWDAVLIGPDTAPEQADALRGHANALFHDGLVSPPNTQLDDETVKGVQRQLRTKSLAERAYALAQLQSDPSKAPDFDAVEQAGSEALNVLHFTSNIQGVSGLYTVAGYRSVFKPNLPDTIKQLRAEDACVLPGSDRPASAVQREADPSAQVTRLYLQDYAAKWKVFIANIGLKSAKGLTGAVELTRALTVADPPLPRLYRAIAREVSLSAQNATDPTLLQNTERQATKIFGGVKKIIGEPAKPKTVGSSIEEQLVDSQFDSIRVLTAGGEGKAPIDESVVLVGKLRDALVAANDALKDKRTPDSALFLPIEQQMQALREPLRSQLHPVAADGKSAVENYAVANIADLIQRELKGCSTAVQGTYPFNRNVQDKELGQGDFERLFGRGGAFDRFFDEHLKGKVDVAARPWRYLGAPGRSADLSSFERAAAIRDLFFPAGGGQARFELTFTPLSLDPALSRFVVKVNAKEIKQSHEPALNQRIEWPDSQAASAADSNSNIVRLTATPLSGGRPTVKEYNGAWALFRALDDAQLEWDKKDDKHFSATFKVDSAWAEFDVRVNFANHPFKPKAAELMTGFRCPA